MKNDRGEITIPQIIFVIVLIVLVGVCIAMLTGENGLFVPKGYNQNADNSTNTNTTNTDESNTNTVDTQKPTEQEENNNQNGALVVPTK